MTTVPFAGVWTTVAKVICDGWPPGDLYYRGCRVASIDPTVTRGRYCLILEGNRTEKVDGATLLRVRTKPPRKVRKAEQMRPF
jgi:hypothetical protein